MQNSRFVILQKSKTKLIQALTHQGEVKIDLPCQTELIQNGPIPTELRIYTCNYEIIIAELHDHKCTPSGQHFTACLLVSMKFK